MLHRVEAYFTFERRVGVMLIFFSITLFLRPIASGLDMLKMLYSIIIPPTLFAIWFLIDGLILLIVRRTGALLFALLIFPLTLYSLLLWWSLFQNPLLGPLGQDYSAVLVGWIIVAQAKRALARKRLRKAVP